MTIQSTNTPSLNVVNWFEIPVTDIAKAAALYGAMIDRELVIGDFGGKPYAVFPHPETGTGGALVCDAKRPPVRGGTVVYLAAPGGVATCLARAVEAGAKVVMPATPIGPDGVIALIADLDGNVVGLHEDAKK